MDFYHTQPDKTQIEFIQKANIKLGVSVRILKSNTIILTHPLLYYIKRSSLKNGTAVYPPVGYLIFEKVEDDFIPTYRIKEVQTFQNMDWFYDKLNSFSEIFNQKVNICEQLLNIFENKIKKKHEKCLIIMDAKDPDFFMQHKFKRGQIHENTNIFKFI